LSFLSVTNGEQSENKNINHGTDGKHGKKKKGLCSVYSVYSVVCNFYQQRTLNIVRIRKFTTEKTENTERRKRSLFRVFSVFRGLLFLSVAKGEHSKDKNINHGTNGKHIIYWLALHSLTVMVFSPLACA